MRLAVLASLLAVTGWSAKQPGTRVWYIGGTRSDVSFKTEGLLQTTGREALVFLTKRSRLRIPYEKINLIEYGQQASRRYAMAVVVSPMFLLSKKRKHFLTVGYTDDRGDQQAMVFEIEKDQVRGALAALEARTGLKVEYQDNEARKAGRGGT